MLALILSVGFTNRVFAQDETASSDFIKSRSYIGLMGSSSTIDQWGDFTGSSYLSSSTTVVSVSGAQTIFSNPEIDYIPSITRDFGFGVMLGHRDGPWAGEISFWRSDHTATIYQAGPVTFVTPASLQSIDLTIKRYFFTQLPTQPFVSLGVCFPWLWVQQGSIILNNASAPPSTLTSDDATYSGMGFDLGAGLEIYLDNGFSLVGGAFQRWTAFSQVNGALKNAGSSSSSTTSSGTSSNINTYNLDGVTGTNISSLEGDGLILYVGTTVGFQ